MKRKQTNKLNGKTVIFNNSNTVCVIFIKNPSFVFIQNTLRLRIRSKLD